MRGGSALKADVLFLDDRCPGEFLGLDPGQDQHLSGGSNSKDALDQVQAVGDPAAQGLPVILAPLAAIGALASGLPRRRGCVDRPRSVRRGTDTGGEISRPQSLERTYLTPSRQARQEEGGWSQVSPFSIAMNEK
ncbi:hypothetical protein JZU46_01495 [bacterium]|nr:hypothetical protein [bacterium]